jgi:hypothetical protein
MIECKKVNIDKVIKDLRSTEDEQISKKPRVRRKTTKKLVKKEVSGTFVDLAYPVKCFNEETSPSCVYIPSCEIMFKLMKACVGCSTPEDLWIFKMEYTPRSSNN